ncbi:MAG: SDR family NAD(P)-dependent oxidoreductase [Rhizomicrobium sp.]
MNFADTVVVVTGASTGLGRAIAVGAATYGAKAVAINYASSRSEAEETGDLVRRAGAEPIIVRGDVGEDGDCRKIVDTVSKFGHIDALFNNAGKTVHASDHANLGKVGIDEFLSIYRVNVVGPYQMIRAARGLLEASPRTGAVVNTASLAAVTGIGSSVPYAASKGALVTMTLSLARALAPKIRVNVICPGFIDTPWFGKIQSQESIDRMRAGVLRGTPLQLASKPEDIAGAALFFASPAARHITGETLMIDAGLHLGFAPIVAR